MTYFDVTLHPDPRNYSKEYCDSTTARFSTHSGDDVGVFVEVIEGGSPSSMIEISMEEFDQFVRMYVRVRDASSAGQRDVAAQCGLSR